MFKYGDSPRTIYEKHEDYIVKSEIWNNFDEVLSASFEEQWDDDFYDKVANLCPAVRNKRLQIKRSKGYTRTPREHLIRNFLLQNPALLAYLYQEVTLCFSEVQLLHGGTGAKPDILLAQWSHRTAPRRYLIVELKLPTESMMKKRVLSSATSQALTEQARRCLYGITQSGFFTDIGVEGVWIDTLILVGAQQFFGGGEAIPLRGVTETFDADTSSQISDAVLGLRKMLSPAQLESYDSLRRCSDP